MNKRLQELYNDHSNHDITFNQSVIKSVGLLQEQIIFKCGDVKLKCIIYSSSLIGARIVIKLTEEHINYIRRKRGAVSLNFTFHIQGEKKNISFYVNSKITNLAIYNENKPDYYFCIIEFINRAPDDLIEILGTHIHKQVNMHKRAEERFILDNGHNNVLSRKSLENVIFISGKGKRCILTEISVFSAKVILVSTKNELAIKDSAMLIIKSKDIIGIGEMVGHIERVELINEEENLYSTIIIFNQEMIPPTYKMWIAEFLEMVNIKK